VVRKLSELGEIDISSVDADDNLLDQDDIEHGEIALEFSEEKLHKTECKLQNVVSSILDSFRVRVEIPDDLTQAEEIFEKTDWYQGSAGDEILSEKLLSLIKKMNTQRTDELEGNVIEIVTGYRIYLDHTRKEKSKGN
jgi:hypothetical protein